MAVEARLADEEPEPAAELERDAFNFAAERVEVAGFLTRTRRDAGRRAKDSELGAQRVAPFARGGPGFGRLDRGGHDIGAARRRPAQRPPPRAPGGLIALRPPRHEPGHLLGLRSGGWDVD